MLKIKGFSLDSRVCKSLFIQCTNTTQVFDSSSNLDAVSTSLSGSLVKEAGSLVNEVKWNTFGSSFAVLDSGLGSEMGDPSQRSLGGKAVKPTQNSISTSGAVNLRKVNRVRGHWSASKSD
ncbi:hypothetical protein YC2023_092201 [Brassica napus]